MHHLMQRPIDFAEKINLPIDRFIEFIFAVVAIPVWELLFRDHVFRWWSSQKSVRAWRSAFRSGESCYFSKSVVESQPSIPGLGPKSNFRDSDVFVEGELMAILGKSVSKPNSDPKIDLNYP
jgi:hypothetical protein